MLKTAIANLNRVLLAPTIMQCLALAIFIFLILALTILDRNFIASSAKLMSETEDTNAIFDADDDDAYKWPHATRFADKLGKVKLRFMTFNTWNFGGNVRNGVQKIAKVSRALEPILCNINKRLNF